MAVVTTKSAVITNRDSLPRVLNNSSKAAGRLEDFVGTVAVLNGDSIGSKYLFGSLPSNARVNALRLNSDAITLGAADFGLQRTTDEGGAVVSAAFFKAAQTIVSQANTDISRGNVTTNANCDLMVWQLLGLLADPGVKYDVVATLTAATSAAGAMSLNCSYAI